MAPGSHHRPGAGYDCFRPGGDVDTAGVGYPGHDQGHGGGHDLDPGLTGLDEVIELALGGGRPAPLVLIGEREGDHRGHGGATSVSAGTVGGASVIADLCEPAPHAVTVLGRLTCLAPPGRDVRQPRQIQVLGVAAGPRDRRLLPVIGVPGYTPDSTAAATA